MTSTTPARRPSERLDGLKVETLNTLGLQEFAGLLLESTPRTLPVSSLAPDEYEARILFHRERVEREMLRLELLERGLKQRGRTTTKEGSARSQAVKEPSLPGKLRYRDLKVVSCARCSRMLLGESQEPLRAAAVAKGLRTARNFPPPVAARLFGGRPYCATCAAILDPPGGVPCPAMTRSAS